MVYNLNRGSLDIFQGRFEGDGNFNGWSINDGSPNLAPTIARNANIPTGIRQGALSVVITGDGVSYAESSTSSYIYSPPLQYTVLSNESNYASFSVSGLQDNPTNPRITSTFTFYLAYDSRTFYVNVSTTALTSFNTTAVRVNTAWTSVNNVALYTTGIRQAMLSAQSSSILATPRAWTRYYSMGYTGAVDIIPVAPYPCGFQGTLMYTDEWNGQRSGFAVVLAGNVADNGYMDGLESWSPTTVSQIRNGRLL